MKRVVTIAIVCSLATGGLLSATQPPSMKDPGLAKRALTDADLEKYVAILAKVTQANKDRKGATSVAAMQEVNAKKAKACEEQGWTTLDYSVVDSRMTAAQMHLKMPSIPIPDDKKADVAIAKKFEARISAAKK